MPEVRIPTEEEIAAIVERAKDLPRIAANDRTPEEIAKASALFGNNFQLLFREIWRKREGESYPPTYLHRAEALGQPWQDFLSQNTALLAEIDAGMKEYEIYLDILQVCIDICVATRDATKARDFGKRFDPELGVNAILIPMCRKLNPLLEQAADAMRKLGIDPIALAG